MTRLLLLVVCLLVVSGLAKAENDITLPGQQVDAMSMSEKSLDKNWYVGGSFGLGVLYGWNSERDASYFQSLGYSRMMNAESENSMKEVKLYAGKPIYEFMDVELGGSYGTNLGGPAWARYYKNGEVTATRRFVSQVLYVAATFWPIKNWRGPYLKLGGHISELDISKSVTGNAANMSALAAGDYIPGDGISTGIGPLLSFGIEFGGRNERAFRLELNRFFRVGGTNYASDSLNFGIHFNI